MPYASATRLASGALRASRPSARTSSSTSLTVAWSREVPVRSCVVVVEAINLPLSGFSSSVGSVGFGRAGRSDGPCLGQLGHLIGLVLEELLENLRAVLAEQGRALDRHG